VTSSSQSSHYGADYDYLRGSPHLRHSHHKQPTSRISEALEPVRNSNPVEVERYWSSQGPAQQRIGERLERLNTFAVFATRHLEEPAGG
jgi:hypothetical protein